MSDTPLPPPPEDTAPGAAPVPEMSPAAVAKALAAQFPLLFGAPRALPLKLRIQADIQARAPGVFTKKALSLFLHRHTTSTAYLKALVSIATRHDLDGQPAGEVAEAHRLAATAEVERRRGIVEARRQAEREAQRQAYRAAARAARAPGGAAEAAPGAAAAGAGADGAAAPAEGRPDAVRPARPPHSSRPPRAQRPPQTAHELREPREPRQPREQREPGQPSPPTADVEARRERAQLLRAFEASTLTKTNFCVLKRISEAELDSRLVLARQEREARGPEARQETRPVPRPDGRPEARHDDRGPRDFGGGRDGRRDTRDSRDTRGPRRDAPRAPLPAGERTRPAGSGATPAAPAGKSPQKPGP